MLGLIISEGLQFLRSERKAKHELKISTIKNKQRLAEDEQSYNHSWEMASLENNDRVLRIASFSMFALPMIVTVISPETGREIFENLAVVPEWYKRGFIAINGGIWGIVELKHAAPQFINALKSVAGK